MCVCVVLKCITNNAVLFFMLNQINKFEGCGLLCRVFPFLGSCRNLTHNMAALWLWPRLLWRYKGLKFTKTQRYILTDNYTLMKTYLLILHSISAIRSHQILHSRPLNRLNTGLTFNFLALSTFTFTYFHYFLTFFSLLFFMS